MVVLTDVVVIRAVTEVLVAVRVVRVILVVREVDVMIYDVMRVLVEVLLDDVLSDVTVVRDGDVTSMPEAVVRAVSLFPEGAPLVVVAEVLSAVDRAAVVWTVGLVVSVTATVVAAAFFVVVISAVVAVIAAAVVADVAVSASEVVY